MEEVFYASMDLIDPTWSPMLKAIGEHFDAKRPLDGSSDEDKLKANGIFIFCPLASGN